MNSPGKTLPKTAGFTATLLLLCIAASVVRFIYGYLYAPWNIAPDQLAWEISCAGNHWTYDQLVHYPHEGGTLLLSLMARMAAFFSSFHPLTVVAFVLDILFLIIKLFVVRTVFGNRTAIAFACWSVFVSPSILPWSTVNFGLHALSSVFPFLFLLLIWKHRTTTGYYAFAGFALGLSCWFSYINIPAAVITVAFLLFRHKKVMLSGILLLSLAAIVLLHLVVRNNTPAGFKFEQPRVTSIRGTHFSPGKKEFTEQALHVWHKALPDAATVVNTSEGQSPLPKSGWMLLTYGGFGLAAIFLIRKKIPEETLLPLLTALVFVLFYAVSPFYYNDERPGNYVLYRHLTYVLPVMALVTIAGWMQLRYAAIPVSVFIAIGVYSSLLLFKQHKTDYVAWREAGWVLGAKYGHDPQRLHTLVYSAQKDTTALLTGSGWGIAAALFTDETAKSPAITQKLEQLDHLLNQFPPQDTAAVSNGIAFAFSDAVTPKLDSAIYSAFEELRAQKP